MSQRRCGCGGSLRIDECVPLDYETTGPGLSGQCRYKVSCTGLHRVLIMDSTPERALSRAEEAMKGNTSGNDWDRMSVATPLERAHDRIRKLEKLVEKQQHRIDSHSDDLDQHRKRMDDFLKLLEIAEVIPDFSIMREGG